MTDAPNPGQQPNQPSYPPAGGATPPPAYGAPTGATPPPAYGAPTGGYAAPAATPKVLGIISMIAGIVGIVSFGYFGIAAIAAVVLGFLSRSREGQPARGFWLTGLILGFIGIGIMIIAIIFWIVIAVSAASYNSY
jgi:hypothetical protein